MQRRGCWWQPRYRSQHGETERVPECHQGAVVRRQEHLGVDAGIREHPGHDARDVLGGPDESRVDGRGILALEQTERADLVAERDVDSAELSPHDLGRGQLVVGIDGREDRGDGNPPDHSGHPPGEARDRFAIERRAYPSVVLGASRHDDLARRDREAQLGGQSASGGIASVSGLPMRITATCPSVLGKDPAPITCPLASIAHPTRAGSIVSMIRRSASCSPARGSSPAGAVAFATSRLR